VEVDPDQYQRGVRSSETELKRLKKLPSTINANNVKMI
jgi:hypothetical protein